MAAKRFLVIPAKAGTQGWITQAVALAGTGLVLALNFVLIAQSFAPAIPGLPSAG